MKRKVFITIGFLMMLSILIAVNVQNPSFENDFEDWTIIGTSSQTSIDESTAYDGSKSCRFSGLTSGYSGREIASNGVIVTPSLDYTALAWFYAPAISGAIITDVKVRVKIYFYDSDDTLVEGTNPNGTSITSENTWQQISRTETAPANSYYAKVIIDAKEDSNHNYNLLIDYIQFEGDQALPVTLTAFTALELEANYVQLSWSVESESNLYGYYLYRAVAESSEMSKISNLITANNLPQSQTYQFVDYEAVSGSSYDYYLEAIDLDGSITMHDPIRFTFAADEEEDNPYLPEELQPLHNYPNPFNPSTTIRFGVPKSAAGENVQLHIYNTKGQKITTLLQENLPTGNHSVTWLGQDSAGKAVNSGIYFYKLQIGNESSELQKMVMIK